MFYYDEYGFLTTRELPERGTVLVPPPESEWPVGARPNWTGFEWKYLDYASNVPPEVLNPPDPVLTAEKVQVLMVLHSLTNGQGGTLYDDYQTFISTASVPVQIAASASTWSTASPNLQAGIQALGLTKAQVRDIFQAAAKIEV